MIAFCFMADLECYNWGINVKTNVTGPYLCDQGQTQLTSAQFIQQRKQKCVDCAGGDTACLSSCCDATVLVLKSTSGER